MVVASRWWSLGLGAAAIVVVLVMFADIGITPRSLWAAGLIAVYVVLWFSLAGRAVDGNAAAIVLTLCTIATTGGATALAPSVAILQFFAFPAVWVLAGSVTGAVIANVVLALAVAAGFTVSLGMSPSALAQTAIVQSISLAFSMVIGFWITRVEHESAQRRRLGEELTAAQDELAVLHRDAGARSEGERWARDLHDTIAQSLTGLVLLEQRARRELAAGSLTDATLGLIEDGTRDALAETRALVAGSARLGISGGGIAEALVRLAERVERETGMRVSATARIDAPLDRDTEVVLLRCAQEGIANARKHADATAASIELEVDAHLATVRVTDNGRGYDPAAPRTGFGLDGLHDRLSLVGGDLRLDGTPGATTLSARVPRTEPAP